MSSKSIPPNDYGKLDSSGVLEGEGGFLVEECQKVDISNLLKVALFELKKTLIQSQLQAEGLCVNLLSSKAGFGGKRLWFECPICKKRVGAFYKHPLNRMVACRKCLGLKYRCSAKKGMVENFVEK